MGLDRYLGETNILTVKSEELFNWGRKSSLWYLLFGIACCAIEMMVCGSSRHDFDRFGIVHRGSPRQADLMFVAGTIHRRRKYLAALEAGAVGFLIAGPLPGRLVAGSSGRQEGPGIPAAGITPEAAAALRRTSRGWPTPGVKPKSTPSNWVKDPRWAYPGVAAVRVRSPVRRPKARRVVIASP